MGRIVIIHYHLNPGGVTRIIESQVQALGVAEPREKCLILTGYCENPAHFRELGADIKLIEALNYLPEESDYRQVYRELSNSLGLVLKNDDILHVHNLNLGKNPVFTYVVADLVKKQFPVINHAHDFAEDRPVNYAFLEKVFQQLGEQTVTEIAYPHAVNFFHVVLNSSDQERLFSYGVPAEKVCLLPNPVVFEEHINPADLPGIRSAICSKLGIPQEKKLITYPVRVIRRKNIGEYILLAWLFREEASWMVTQPPKNPVEITYYEQWKKFCDRENIPMIFEAGNQVDFEELLHASDFCFTTSIKEGFGMVYMEPWLMNTPVIGRNLPIITRDLEQFGIQFPLLYNSLLIRRKGELTDFGTLTMEEQMEYIKEILQDIHRQKELYQCNPFLNKLLNSIADSVVQKNKHTILQQFSLANYGQQLKSLYKKFTG